MLRLSRVDGVAATHVPPAALATYAPAVWHSMLAFWKAGLLQGDVALRNIMLRPDGGATVVDLGLAQRLADHANPKEALRQEVHKLCTLWGPPPHECCGGADPVDAVFTARLQRASTGGPH